MSLTAKYSMCNSPVRVGPSDRDREAVLAELGDLVSPPDAAILSGEYAQIVGAELLEALRRGILDWFDDDLAILGDRAFELGRIERAGLEPSTRGSSRFRLRVGV